LNSNRSDVFFHHEDMMKKSGTMNTMRFSEDAKFFLNGFPIGTAVNVPVELRGYLEIDIYVSS